jgi:lipopolysaccharide export system permease protein
MTFAAINLVIIALAVTSANPRVGRGGNFALALFIFVIYYNFINLGQSWISSGKVQLWPFMLALHGGAFLLAALWLTLRHNQWSWQRLFKTSNVKEQAA